MIIGVISDTHIPTKARKIPDFVFETFSKVDLIIHAGDICSQEVLDILSELAPVKAVYGNIDPPILRKNISEKMKMEINEYIIGVTHGHNVRGHLMDKLAYVFPQADVIIFGHTHRPFNQKIAGKLYFNPGSATDRRMEKKHSIGLIKIDNKIEGSIVRF